VTHRERDVPVPLLVKLTRSRGERGENIFTRKIYA
jgi:hypothetical protein